MSRRACYPSVVQPEASLLARAIEGDARAIRAIVDLLTPVIQARVARVLFSRFNGSKDLDEAVADATQDVFALLFADDARVLRSWSEERGLSLANFVGLVAARHVLSGLRGGSRVGAREQATADEDLDLHRSEGGSPESQLTRRMTFDAVVARVEAELTDQGKRIFELVLLEDRTIESICDELSMSADAIYAWRSRLLKTVRRVASELEAEFSSEAGGSTRSPEERTRHE